jgi:hypothetical protein
MGDLEELGSLGCSLHSIISSRCTISETLPIELEVFLLIGDYLIAKHFGVLIVKE